MNKRNSSLQGRKQSKSKLKANKSQEQNGHTHDLDFYGVFLQIYQQVQRVPYDQFDYMQEFFNIGVREFPSDIEIATLQKHILDASGWVTTLKKNWNLDEKKVLIWVVGKLSQLHNMDIRQLDDQFWGMVQSVICRRDAEQCKQKWASMQKIALQQQPFSPEEDRKLVEIIQQYQSEDQGQRWSQIATELNQNTNIYRSSKQCRERWLNHLNPNISKEPWTDQEDILLMNHVKSNGRRWAEISKMMDGRRSENTLKNRFNSLIKREKELTVKDNNHSYTIESLLANCAGSELNELQCKGLDAVLKKLQWRAGENSGRIETVRNSIDRKPSIIIEQVKRASLSGQQQIRYNVGNMDIERDINPHELTPCLVDMSRNIIYFPPSEVVQQVIYQNQHQTKNQFDRLKGELSLFDMGWQNFKSTLSMIEEMEESQVSQSIQGLNNYITEDLDRYFNLDTPQTVSRQVYLNPFEQINKRAFDSVQKAWRTEQQLIQYQQRQLRSLPNMMISHNHIQQ